MAASTCDVFSFCVGVAGRARVSVEVRFVSSAKGKGLFATQLIRKGETIFVERPLVAAQFLWNALYRYRACDHCLRALEKAEENAQRLTGKPGQVLPHPELCTVRKDLHQNCPHCQVMYCSAECRLAATEQYHQVLCPGPSQDDPLHPLNKLQEAWRSVHYPPETASIMLMARMVATVKQAKDKDRWIRLFSQFCNKTANEEEEIVHKLLGDKFKGQLELLRRLFTEALYEEAVSQWFTPDGFRSLFALVGTNGQGIGTSSLSQWVHACDALELKPQDREQLDIFIDQLYKDIEAATGEFLNCEGSGLFVLQSCCSNPHYLPLVIQATTVVCPMQRPPFQKTTSFCMSLLWRILSQERKFVSATWTAVSGSAAATAATRSSGRTICLSVPVPNAWQRLMNPM
ncbi:protein-lysine N-trimethyltransferase SMYD5 isoform X2 [Macaca fascicularis]|uniref:SET and MYND domain-containing protein 5 isoform X2 n=1 Tax=Macaca mulatta TaxID=9544 RepID=UPI000732BD81|nr:SET and MYND domain-containing protein 5 isoform X2 [Macaca mulatta]